MQNIRNFKLADTTSKNLTNVSVAGDPVFSLESEDGQDWYGCHPLFADDTIKIAYDADGVIRSVVDKPVPQCRNTYAVSMLFPLNLSVAEMAADDYPTGVTLDGTWKFDGTRVYRDTDAVDSKTLSTNAARRDGLLLAATLSISAIKCSAAVGNPRDGDADDLHALQQYADQLRDVNVTSPAWPDKPNILSN